MRQILYSGMEYGFHNQGVGNMTKIVQISERTQIDHETGEVRQETRENVYRLPQEPRYVKMYIEDLGRLLDVPPGPRDILYHLVRRLDYEGLIGLTPGARQRICETANIKPQTLANYLTTLCKKNVLKHVGRGEYEMNPRYFAKGDWKDIAKRRSAFEMTVRYSPDGQRIINGKSVDQMDIEDLLASSDQQPASSD